METPSSQSSPDQAQQVCTTCKTRKRKCNKALPKCSSCSRKNLTCDYSRRSDRSRSYVTERVQYSSRPDDDRPEVPSIDIPTILFLDPGILQHGQVEVPTPGTPIPAFILELLGDTVEIQATASKFFEHVHLWMPFISKKRFYDLHLRPSFQSRPDIVLLFLSLKLITTLPPKSPRSPRTNLYHALKHFYLDVEGSSVFSISVLQAGLLLALYELGHAIYPAAFLSIGACARYAHALGITGSKLLSTRKVLTLLEVEEERRVWWAIVILERFVSIGCPGRPFVTSDPGLDDLLPTDDEAWDQGIIRSNNSFTLSSPMTSHMSKFALLCQAARLMGQVLHHVSTANPINDDIWLQLDRTLQSMLTVSLDVDLPDYDQITFIYSALIALHTPWLSTDGASKVKTDRSRRARAVIHQITETISMNLTEKQCFLGRNPEDLPPWGLYFAYHICLVHIRSTRKTPASSEVVKSLRETFLMIDARWNVAGTYLQLLEAQEAMNSS